MKLVSQENALKYYQWGKNCEGWTMVDEPDLTVKVEAMPAGTEEVLHYHAYAQQFFFHSERKCGIRSRRQDHHRQGKTRYPYSPQ